MKLSFGEITDRVSKAIRETHGKSISDKVDCYCWVTEIYEDEAVYQQSDKYFKIGFSLDSKTGEVSLGEPTEVQKVTSYKAVFSDEKLFAAFSSRTEDDMVIKSGEVFEAGDYPDKNVAFDDADLDAIVASFDSPVDNDIEHRASILDGHLGKLQKVWKEGKKLYGDVAIPTWLDKLNGKKPIKVSLAFDRNKRIVGNGLVLNPRIKTAAVMSAFSDYQSSLETNPRSGAQEIGTKIKMKLKDILHFFGLESAENPEAEVTLAEGVVLPTEDATPPAQKTETPAAPVFDGPNPAGDETTARLKAMELQFSALADQAVKTKAIAFADDIIAKKKAMPSQRDGIAEMYFSAVKTDAGSGPAFSAESGVVSGASVKQLTAFFENQPTHAFAGESIPDGTAGALLFGQASATIEMSDTRKAQLLGASSLGRQVMTEASKN